jgi:hypothetical protein
VDAKLTTQHHKGKNMRDIRNAKRAERAYFAQNAPQRCIVCGKWFVRRQDRVCSRDCLEKQEQQAKQQAKQQASAGRR